MRENNVKTMSLEEGSRYDYPALLGHFKLMPKFAVGPSECETKFTSKHFGMGNKPINKHISARKHLQTIIIASFIIISDTI